MFYNDMSGAWHIYSTNETFHRSINIESTEN